MIIAVSLGGSDAVVRPQVHMTVNVPTGNNGAVQGGCVFFKFRAPLLRSVGVRTGDISFSSPVKQVRGVVISCVGAGLVIRLIGVTRRHQRKALWHIQGSRGVFNHPSALVPHPDAHPDDVSRENLNVACILAPQKERGSRRLRIGGRNARLQRYVVLRIRFGGQGILPFFRR